MIASKLRENVCLHFFFAANVHERIMEVIETQRPIYSSALPAHLSNNGSVLCSKAEKHQVQKCC